MRKQTSGCHSDTLFTDSDSTTPDASRGLNRRLIKYFHRTSPSVDVDNSSNGRYIFSYELDVDKKNGVKPLNFVPFHRFSEQYEGSQQKEEKCTERAFSFDYGRAFDFGVGNEIPSDMESNFGTTFKTIFTYSTPLVDAPIHLDRGTEYVNRVKSVDEGFSLLLLTLSALFLLVFFPILGFVFIRHLTSDERFVIFRLGRRIKPKGPGWVILLPFCDDFYLVSLAEQTVKVKPVSGSTSDEAIVELSCSVLYRLSDIEYAYANTKDGPSTVVSTQAQLCLLSAMSRLPWAQLDQGGAVNDLATETLAALNCRCGSQGIVVNHINIEEIKLIRANPSPKTVNKSQISIIGQQLRALSSAFLSSGRASTAASASVNGSLSESSQVRPGQVATDGDGTSVSVKTRAGSFVSPKLSKVMETSSTESTPLLAEENSGGTLFSKALAAQMDSVRSICSQALSRAQPFLNNESVCIALGRSSMQLFVFSGNLPEPLPTVDQALNDGSFIPLYLDARSGQAAYGILPGLQQATVALYLTADDLAGILSGRLNMSSAIASGSIHVTGDRACLNKLRHLLYLAP